jgi:hypothetical protein
VAFASNANDLVSTDTNHVIDVFVKVLNQPPTVDAGGPYSVDEGAVVMVTASGSDPEGGALTYAWDLDNNGSFETPGQSATFSAAGLDGPSSRTINAQVTDNAGLTATAQATVNVLNVAPTATFNAPAMVNKGSAINLALTGPGDPSSADTAAGFTYAFDCGDGAGYGVFGASNTASCSTSGSGSRVVRGQIRDKDGGVTEYTATVLINVAPIVDAGPNATVIQGNPFLRAGTFSDPDPDTWTATVDYGDGSGIQPLALTGKTFNLSHGYAAGRYTLTVTVSDNHSGVGVGAVIVTVLTPREGLEGLIEKVNAFVAAGALNKGQGNGLIAKLEAAIQQLEHGNTKTAINQLQAFVNQMNAFIRAGIVSPAQGQPLIDSANQIIAALGG